MRNHGWELPYHPLQTVGIAVFTGLSFSFYVFFIPFVGSNVLKFHIYAAFSPVVLALVVLYVWCVACDPADPGVHQSRLTAEAKRKRKVVKASTSSDVGLKQSQDGSDRSIPSTFPLKNEGTNVGKSICCSLGSCLHNLVCKKPQETEKVNTGEHLLYCSICDAEISKNSKHCRACDKCVTGFDHHCRWLNNCVGNKNYRIFVALMVTCLLMLLILWATGILVIVRCFSQRESFDKEIAAHLGSSFSRMPYIILVGSLTLLALVATLPLVQLFFFHMILVHKGLTTYDYILAVRDQEQGLREGDGMDSMMSSPASSAATGLSGYSSSGGLAWHQGVLCTPPRMFVEHQQTVLPYINDLEASGDKLGKRDTGTMQGPKKVSVGINPWKLAHISTEEAIRAAVRAHETSSIMQPTRYAQGSSHITETEESSRDSSHSASGELMVVGSCRAPKKCDAYLSGKDRWMMLKEWRDKNILHNGALGHPLEPMLSLKPRSPLAGHHQRMLFKCSPSRFSGELRNYPEGSYPRSSYNGSNIGSPDIYQNSPDLELPTQVLVESSLAPNCGLGKVLLERSASDGYEASVGESGDENGEQCQQPDWEWNTTKLLIALMNPTEKVATWEESSDEDLLGPRWSLGSRSLGSKGSSSYKAESFGGHASCGSRAEANILKHVKKDWPDVPDVLSISSGNSNSSSPTHFNSPERNSSNSQTTRDSISHCKTPEEKQMISVYDGTFASLTSKAMPGTKSLLST